MKMKCHVCGKLAVYVKDVMTESKGFYTFECDCGNGWLAPKRNPEIIHDYEQ